MEPKTIAVIEDDKLLSKLVSDALHADGFNIVAAYDGEEGLRLVTNEHPALVLLDIKMPKLDGLGVLKQLKTNEETKNIPIIMLTNLDSDKTVIEASHLGSLLYMAKSKLSLEQLSKWVKEILL